MADQLFGIFNVNEPEEWPAYKERILSFFVAKDVTDSEKKLAYLKLYGGQRICKLLEILPIVQEGAGLSISLVKGDVFEEGVMKLDNYFESKRNPLLIRLEFRQIQQRVGETMKQFVFRLREVADKCNFDDGENAIREQLVYGALDEKVRVRVMKNWSLNLDDLVDEVTLDESFKMSNKQKFEDVNLVSTRKPTGVDGRRCYFCKKIGHIKKDCRQLKNVMCYHCKKLGHIKPNCPALKLSQRERGNFTNRPSIRYVAEESQDLSDPEYVFFMDGGDMVECLIGGVKVNLLVDSGCISNIIDESTWKSMKEKKVMVKETKRGSDKQFRAYGDKAPLTVLGSFKAIIQIGSEVSEEMFYVVKEGNMSLLGSNTAKDLKVLQINKEVVSYDF